MPSAWMPRDEYVRTLPKATAYACLYFTDESGRPFQLRSFHPYETWQCPGGNMDPGETPWQTAVRETREETGLIVTGRRPLLLTHFIAPRLDWPHGHIGFVFDGGVLTTAQLDRIVLDPNEHTDWDVRGLEEWRKEMNERKFTRLTALDAARRTGTAGYLETA